MGLGLDPWAFASGKQRAWKEAAEQALRVLDEGGAFTRGYHFIVYDERPLTAPLNWLINTAAQRYGQPREGSVAHSMAMPAGAFPPSSLRAIGASREGREASQFIRDLALAVGSPLDARVFAAAHEFGHAWQTAHGFCHIREAALACEGSDIAADMVRRIDAYGSPEGEADKTPASLCRILFEESVADAIGCWALARRGVDRPFARLAQMRGEGDARDVVHRSSWLLSAIDGQEAARQEFPQFMAALAALMAKKAPKVFEAFESAAKPRAPGLGP